MKNTIIRTDIKHASNINPYNYAESLAFVSTLAQSAKAGRKVYENTVNKLNNCRFARQLRNHHSLRDLFITHWPAFLEQCKAQNITLRAAIHDNVNRMMACKDLSKGYLYYDCPNCDHMHLQGLSCHSRFCASCGKKYRDARTLAIAKQCLDVRHRQFVFSISDTLRPYFRTHRAAQNLLFKSVRESLDWLLYGKSKRAHKEKRQFGYVLFLHTFGRDIKFNPHIHALIAEATLDINGKRKSYQHFHYESLRKSFMRQLLKNMKAYLKPKLSRRDMAKFHALVHSLYKRYPNGFYTHGPRNTLYRKSSVTHATEYIARYAGHPPISESRIMDIDDEKRTITYYYDPHEDDHHDDKKGRQVVTEDILTFIGKLIVHIPDKHFHTIRRYGFYANRSKHLRRNPRKLYSPQQIEKMNRLLDWRQNMRYIYKYDPLLCSCGAFMVLNLSHSYLPQKHQRKGAG